MISKEYLKELVSIRLKDANSLFTKNRFDACYYLAGYALELSLKYKICLLYNFEKGFPENKGEFNSYFQSKQDDLNKVINDIREIKHHELSKLLFYSGEEYSVKKNQLEDWNLVASWNPQMRYSILNLKKKDAEQNLGSIKKLVRLILN